MSLNSQMNALPSQSPLLAKLQTTPSNTPPPTANLAQSGAQQSINSAGNQTAASNQINNLAHHQQSSNAHRKLFPAADNNNLHVIIFQFSLLAVDF